MREHRNSSRNRRSLSVAVMIVIAVLTSFMIISCGSSDGDALGSDAVKTTSSEQETTKAKEKEESKAESAQEETQTGSDVKATTAKSASTKSTGSANNTKSTTKSDKSSAKETTKSTQAAKVCYISIEGYCSNEKVTMQNGDTVYDILKRSGANVSARNSGYGIYVEGINGRFEFDEGPTSGWIYYVNGSKPNKSCGEYKVSSGDKITWDYISEL